MSHTLTFLTGFACGGIATLVLLALRFSAAVSRESEPEMD